MYFEKLQLVCANSINTSSNDEGKWEKLAKNIRKANNPLLIDKTGNGIKSNIEKKQTDNKVEPAVGVLIDFEDENNKKDEDC